MESESGGSRRMLKGTKSIIYLLDLQPFRERELFFRHQICFEISSSAAHFPHPSELRAENFME